MVIRKVALAVCCTLMSQHALSHGIPVHQAMSERVFAKWQERKPDVLSTIGVDEVLHGTNDPHEYLARALTDGSALEDEPPRPVAHFFDPQNGGRGLFSLFPSSRGWALESNGERHLNVGNAVYPQQWSLKEANEKYYQSLTSSRDERTDKWANLFRNLGQVIHHVQDMTQPAHTRDDQHLSGFDSSHFEEYTVERTESVGLEALAGDAGLDYPVPSFSVGAEFWGALDGAPFDGVAEFTSRNFVSKDTNFRVGEANLEADPHYPSPIPEDVYRVQLGDVLHDGGAKCAELIAAIAAENKPSDCVIDFVTTTVVDDLAGSSEANTRAAAFSLLHPFLQKLNVQYIRDEGGIVAAQYGMTGLNKFTYHALYPHIFGRAIAYSTGVIDYFFRGRLQVIDVIVRDSIVTVRFENQSESAVFHDEGFEIWYDDEYGDRKKIEGVTGFHSPLQPDDYMEVQFRVPYKLASTGKSLSIVYKGQIGNEQGVAGTSFSLPRHGFVVTRGDGKHRLVEWNGLSWQLSEVSGYIPGDIDWKGRYVDGKATKLLSWYGLDTRYFVQNNTRPWPPKFSDPRAYLGGVIFEGGEILSRAPEGTRVLGAAIQRDASGKDWLVAVVTDFENDIVVRKRYRWDRSSNWADASKAPQGWERLLTIPHLIREKPNTHWFFNGSGTEAQSVRTMTDEPVRRKVNIDGASAFVVDLDTGVGVTLRDEVSACVYGIGSRTRTTLGSTIVAVDYIDDKEVTAVLHIDETRATGVSGNFMLETVQRNLRLSSSTTGDILLEETNSTVGPQYVEDSVVQRVEFLDLRTGTAALTETTKHEEYDITSRMPGFANYVHSVDAKYLLRTSDREKVLGTFQDSQPQPYGAHKSPSNCRTWPAPGVTERPKRLRYIWYGGLYRTGSDWAAPNYGQRWGMMSTDLDGNILLSLVIEQGASDRNHMGFLSGGDLKHLFGVGSNNLKLSGGVQ